MKRMIPILLICLAAGCSAFRTNRPPKHMAIDTAFFKCEKCRSLEGGIYGKGPSKYLHSPEGKKCIHEWQRISKEEFEALGTKWQGIDWKKETALFWRETENLKPVASPDR